MKSLGLASLLVCAWLSGCIVDTRRTSTDTDTGSCGYGGSSTTTIVYCSASSDCDAGSYCDAASGTCTSGTSCAAEADCPSEFNCNVERGTCEPASMPSCGELFSAEDCGRRTDCRTIYAGVDCSCGPGCACQGGDPGCVCQSFEFFECSAAP